MCLHPSDNIIRSEKYEKKYRLSNFFDAHWDCYVKNPAEPIRPEQFKAVNAIRACRTEKLGVDIYACPGCGGITEVYHSCKNRFCPTCSWQDTMKWAERVESDMFEIPHRHTVFTLPHELNPLVKRNGKLLLNMLIKASSATMTEWMEKKHGIKAGIISVLHTFGETKQAHYHTHMIVSWGGLDLKTEKLRTIQEDYVNYDFLKNKFRCKFEDSLVERFDKGMLDHDFDGRRSFMKFLKHINKHRWVAHLEPPVHTPVEVVRYIGRYSKRACLSEYKITNIEGEYLSFKHKNYKKTDESGKPAEEILRLHYKEFFPRLLQHVPHPYFRVVRYFGIYSNRLRSKVRQMAEGTEITADTAVSPAEESNSSAGCSEKIICRHCGFEKIYHHTVIKGDENQKIIEIRRFGLSEKHEKSQKIA